jgi:hypothetical protein
LFRLLIHPVLKKFVALSINFFKFLKFWKTVADYFCRILKLMKTSSNVKLILF